MRLADRDRHLCAILAEARWLTTEQIRRLAFAGRQERDYQKRLIALSRGLDGRLPLLVSHRWETREARKTVWAVTIEGRDEAARILDARLEAPPRSFDPGAMHRHFALTELYVGLLATAVEATLARVPPRLASPERKKALAGLYARAYHRAWRWNVAGDIVELPWKWRDGDATKPTVQRPDAVLELVVSRRRVFIECETAVEALEVGGGEPRARSLMAKLARWERYVSSVVDPHARTTWYQHRFRDGYAPQVMFLVWSDRRARIVDASIEEWRRKSGVAPRIAARALTLRQALEELLPLTSSVKGAQAAPVDSDSAGYVRIPTSDARAVFRYVKSSRDDLLERRKLAAAENREPPRNPEEYERVKGLIMRLQEEQQRRGL